MQKFPQMGEFLGIETWNPGYSGCDFPAHGAWYTKNIGT